MLLNRITITCNSDCGTKITIMIYRKRNNTLFANYGIPMGSDDTMKRILINMQNTLFCNAISETLRRSGNELDPYPVDCQDRVLDDCRWITPYALLMEVTGYTPWKLEERMKLRDAVKELCPECKIVLVVDENAEKVVAKKVKQAKKDGLIDQFIYSSISAAYLADIVDSL